jgi:uncharacterized protein
VAGPGTLGGRIVTAACEPLVAGAAAGPALVLTEPLSFWGGFDVAVGRIIERRHPQHGAHVTGSVLVMPGGRGSSSSSSVIAEAVRAGTAPAAIVLAVRDPIIALGALVAQELYGVTMPVLWLAGEAYAQLRTGDAVAIAPDGRIEFGVPSTG